MCVVGTVFLQVDACRRHLNGSEQNLDGINDVVESDYGGLIFS